MSDDNKSYCVDCRKEVLSDNVISVIGGDEYCTHRRLPQPYRFVDANGNETYVSFKWSGDVDVLNR